MYADFPSGRVRLGNERIAAEDSERQERAAVEILRRLERQPGVVLADEVGMGKTFVALAVATSVLLSRDSSGPVVVMVPSSLKDKWPKDWAVFREKCLSEEAARCIRSATARSGLEFLKILDDPPSRRAHLVFLTHGALNRSLTDGFARLAVLRRAFKKRYSLAKQRKAFPRFAGRLLWLDYVEKRAPGIFERLLDAHCDRWLRMLHRAHPKFREEIQDDPVPLDLEQVLNEMDSEVFENLVEALRGLPLRESPHLAERLRDTRHALADLMKKVWEQALGRIQFRSPLLILDEAHHVKNPATRLASLFVDEQAAQESDLFESSGPLGGKFERMLFLTATPFQLGHDELVRVLDRFEGITWEGLHVPKLTRTEFHGEIRGLAEALNDAQASALRLDRAWGKLDTGLLCDGDRPLEVDEWWETVRTEPGEGMVSAALAQVEATHRAMQTAEQRLRPWVLRHLKREYLPDAPQVKRRKPLPGAAIRDDCTTERGLEIDGDVLLPFLLAGRAQGILAASKCGRALFAEGLASSFEAYVQTRGGQLEVDEDADLPNGDDNQEVRWYLRHLDEALAANEAARWAGHPKIRATAETAVRLWGAGEKVLVFCHYRETGRALRAHVSARLQTEIERLGAERFSGLAKDRISDELDAIGDRFFDSDGVLRREVSEALTAIVAPFSDLSTDEQRKVVEIVRRFLRTPSFLVRYFDLAREDRGEAFREAIQRTDVGGLSLRERIEQFCAFLSECIPEERDECYEALESIQTGTHVGREIAGSYDPEEQGIEPARTVLLPNVRLANGGVLQETRRKLLLAFNAPLFPEILIASSVLAEGVDLHRNCRYVIHHDLCWNPSTLEQRTGRVDRIGSKAERVKASIYVYLPYVAATQDEKMYRVVKDRERWFRIVMGEKYEVDEAATDRRAERVPLPDSVAKSLVMSLHL